MNLLKTKNAIKPTRSFETGFRLAPEERCAIQLAAAQNNQTLSGYMRSRALAGHIRIIHTKAKASPSVLIQLRRIVTNLDQIADELLRREAVDPKDIRDTAIEIDAFVTEQILSSEVEPTPSTRAIGPRSSQVKVRFTTAEHVHLEGQANKANCSLSAFLREQALRGLITIKQPAKDASPDFIRNLRDLGLYLNRMAHRLNAGGDIPSELDHICHLIRRTFREEFVHGAPRGKTR